MSYTGIDYGHGQTNVNHETGIRYGVISQGSVGQAWSDEAEANYGAACCPKCGNAAMVYDGSIADGTFENAPYCCTDYMCVDCKYIFDSGEAFSDEPNGYTYVGDGYSLESCLDSDIMVLESPYYTLAQFCSPCVPGAGNLDNAMDDGVKTYCLGHDWFESAVAPYPVYSVATGKLVRGGRID